MFEKHIVNFLFFSQVAKIPDSLSKHYLFKVNNKNTRRRYKNMFSDVVLVSLMLNLNIFCAFF